MLRKIVIDQRSDGYPIAMPKEMTERNFEQQIKLFIEIADYNPMDGQLHISHFRSLHGGVWTRRILDACVQELQSPSIELDISGSRERLLLFFLHQQDRHNCLQDAYFQQRPPQK